MSHRQQQHHYSAAAHRQRQAHLGQEEDDDDDDEEEDDEEDENFRHHDGIRRSYHHKQQQQQQQQHQDLQQANTEQQRHPQLGPKTIQVTLNEGYFASERRLIVGLAANLRARLAGLQLFNPAKNDETIRQQEQWTDKEKYTLDSLNEFKANLDDRIQWSQPPDGREVWPTKLQYFLAIISYSIGLGNVIRFPILVQKNGGLAFILPFVVMLIVEGIPLLYLELAIGQRMRKAAIASWNLVSPIAAGIGLASAMVSFVIGLYYNTMVSWTLVYLWASASQPELPFAKCPRQASSSGNDTTTSGTTGPQALNASAGEFRPADAECQAGGPFEFYWYRRTLDVSADVDDWAPFNWPIGLWLACAWLISYLCLARGLFSSKRLVYVASTFPYVILLIFFFKALRLRGWQEGVYYLFAPQWPKLLDPYVWLQAAAQVFFSLGLGFGGLIALSSYNPINNNCHRDAVKVALVNFATSMFAGIVVFALLGFKASLSHEKCLLQRDQQIDFYLADYNLKVLDNGALFRQVPRGSGPNSHGKPTTTAATMAPRAMPPEFVADSRQDNNRTASADQDQDDYDSEDAIASINNLDRQLDLGSPSGQFDADYADADVEFLINASGLISGHDLETIIANIPNLRECSIGRELDRATQGQGLVFVVLAEALSQFEANERLWALGFFLMILALGFDSQFGNLEGLLSSLMDLPRVQAALSRQQLTGLICALSLASSLAFFAHGSGSYMFAIFDEYAASFSLVLIALFELLAISHVYGLRRFSEDCELMTGQRPSFLVLLSWRLLAPLLLLIVTLATLYQFSVELDYQVWWPQAASGDGGGGHHPADLIEVNPSGNHFVEKPWPPWCILLGACLVLVCVLWIPGLALLGSVFKLKLLGDHHHQRPGHHHQQEQEEEEEQLGAPTGAHCGWFPAEDLREYHGLRLDEEQRKPTRLERILFGFTDEDYY